MSLRPAAAGSPARTRAHSLSASPEPAFLCLTANILTCTCHTHAHSLSDTHTGFQASAAVIQDHLLPCKYSRGPWLRFLSLQGSSVPSTHAAYITLFRPLCNIHGAQSPPSFPPGTQHCHARPGCPPQSTFTSTANRIILQCVCDPLHTGDRGCMFAVCSLAHWTHNCRHRDS